MSRSTTICSFTFILLDAVVSPGVHHVLIEHLYS